VSICEDGASASANAGYRVKLDEKTFSLDDRGKDYLLAQGAAQVSMDLSADAAGIEASMLHSLENRKERLRAEQRIQARINARSETVNASLWSELGYDQKVFGVAIPAIVATDSVMVKASPGRNGWNNFQAEVNSRFIYAGEENKSYYQVFYVTKDNRGKKVIRKGWVLKEKTAKRFGGEPGSHYEKTEHEIP
jgi:hypothetical protein